MNTQQLTQLAALRTSQPDKTDAEFLAWGVTPVYTEHPAMVTYMSLRALIGKAKVDIIHTVVAAADPIGDQLMFTTGVDVNFPEAKTLLAALPTATGGAITEADCDLIRDVGRTASRPFDTLGEVVQADLDLLPRLPLITALNTANEARFAEALSLYNAGQAKCDQLRTNSALEIPADLAGLDAME